MSYETDSRRGSVDDKLEPDGHLINPAGQGEVVSIPGVYDPAQKVCLWLPSDEALLDAVGEYEKAGKYEDWASGIQSVEEVTEPREPIDTQTLDLLREASIRLYDAVLYERDELGEPMGDYMPQEEEPEYQIGYFIEPQEESGDDYTLQEEEREYQFGYFTEPQEELFEDYLTPEHETVEDDEWSVRSTFEPPTGTSSLNFSDDYMSSSPQALTLSQSPPPSTEPEYDSASYSSTISLLSYSPVPDKPRPSFLRRLARNPWRTRSSRRCWSATPCPGQPKVQISDPFAAAPADSRMSTHPASEPISPKTTIPHTAATDNEVEVPNAKRYPCRYQHQHQQRGAALLCLPIVPSRRRGSSTSTLGACLVRLPASPSPSGLSPGQKLFTRMRERNGDKVKFAGTGKGQGRHNEKKGNGDRMWREMWLRMM